MDACCEIVTVTAGFQSQLWRAFGTGCAATGCAVPGEAGCQSGSDAATVAELCCVYVSRRTAPVKSVTHRSAFCAQAMPVPSGDHAGRAKPLAPRTVWVTGIVPEPSAFGIQTCPLEP